MATDVRLVGIYRALSMAQSAGETSAADLTESALARIAAAADLNAVVLVDSESARQQARRIDDKRARGEPLGPLAGLPAVVKDNADVRGLPTTHGSLLCADVPAAPEDDSVVAHLRQAGAVIVGKTNLSEFAMEAVTDNRLFGATHNPWKRGMSPGGSSGGSAVALSAGLAIVATGTDGGGSVRIPAALCGLVGLKPTSGVVGSRATRIPLELSSTGPLAQTIADLRILAELTLRPAEGDPSCVYGAQVTGDDQMGKLYAIPRIAGSAPVDIAIEDAFVCAAEAFGRCVDREVVFLSGELLDAAADEVWATIYSAEDTFAVGWNVIEEHYDLLDPRVRPWVERGLATTLPDYLDARRARCRYVRELDVLLGERNILLSPTMGTVGFPIGGHVDVAADELMPIDLFNTAALNLTGHPALNLPAGQIEGMPFGLQIIGPRGSDFWLMNVARSWERDHPWPLTAPGYELFGPLTA